MTTLARGTRVLLRTPHGDTDHGRVRRVFMGLALLELGQGRKPKWFLRSSLWPLDPEPTPMLVATGDPDWSRRLEGRRFAAIDPGEELDSDRARIEEAHAYAFPDRPAYPTRELIFDDSELAPAGRRATAAIPGLTDEPIAHDGGAAFRRRQARALSPW